VIRCNDVKRPSAHAPACLSIGSSAANVERPIQKRWIGRSVG
jgi:hypothetical protein